MVLNKTNHKNQEAICIMLLLLLIYEDMMSSAARHDFFDQSWWLVGICILNLDVGWYRHILFDLIWWLHGNQFCKLAIIIQDSYSSISQRHLDRKSKVNLLDKFSYYYKVAWLLKLVQYLLQLIVVSSVWIWLHQVLG